MDKALRRLTPTSEDGFGAFEQKWFAYTTMVSPLAAMLDVIERDKLDHHAYELLKRWYWSSVFLERYAGAVESTITRDFQDMRLAFSSATTPIPQALSDAQAAIVDNVKYGLRDTARLNVTYRGVMCLITMRGAKDFSANDDVEFHTLDDHHVFARAYLRKLPSAKSPRADAINSIVNRTLISGPTNRRISRRSPSDYLQQIVPDGLETSILASHYIEQDALEAMRADAFEAFTDAREQTLLAEVRRRISGTTACSAQTSPAVTTHGTRDSDNVMPNQLDLPIEPTESTDSAARDAERARYLARLCEYLKDPEFRTIEGFPIGEDEDILALSDPPYYTACPNPFLPEIIAQWQQEREKIRSHLPKVKDLRKVDEGDEDYHREPYASDVSEGKNNPIDNAHSYHTKVPHKAIMRYILHYTDPGDIVLDAGGLAHEQAGRQVEAAEGVCRGYSMGTARTASD